MKKLMKIMAGVILTAFVLGFAACSDGGSSEPQTTTGFTPRFDPETECSITVAGHYNNFEALEAEFVRFSEYYPNVKLTYVYMDGYSKSGSRILSTALAGSEAPDIFFTYPWMSGWVDGREILAASEDLADPALGLDLSCIRPGLLSYEDGKLYSVPIYTTTYGMMVNEDIFKKEGLKVPTTYEELISACEALKAAGYSDPVLACSKSSGDLLYPLFYPYLCGQIKGDETALNALNSMSPRAGEYIRSTMELIADFMGHGFLNLDSCNALEDNYEAVILRFFEGDVPIMLATGNTVSGTEKREAKSEAFIENPFTYSLYPVPSTENGGYFVNSISMGFGVNKNSRNLEMANEFMRFLVSTEELNRMAKAKRMVTPCVDMSLDSVYAPFQAMDESHFINVSELGLDDEASSWITNAGYNVSLGNMTVDEAVESYGSK